MTKKSRKYNFVFDFDEFRALLKGAKRGKMVLKGTNRPTAALFVIETYFLESKKGKNVFL